ncbi:MAG: AsmA family protein, partial [Gammaproteobacteria bacterium]|nr:AsmA family protein [Gammaproteobacteria bacterium]
MKAIRWGGLITFIVIAGIMAAIALFSGAVLKPVLEDKFSEMNGARVDIDAINIGYSPFSLEIKNIQIADPAQPMINTAQIDQVKFELSFGRLLMGQMVIDDASIRGIRVETPRKTSGLISKKVEEKPVEVET